MMAMPRSSPMSQRVVGRHRVPDDSGSRVDLLQTKAQSQGCGGSKRRDRRVLQQMPESVARLCDQMGRTVTPMMPARVSRMATGSTIAAGVDLEEQIVAPRRNKLRTNPLPAARHPYRSALPFTGPVLSVEQLGF